MKKFLKIALCVLVAAAAVLAIYRFCFRKSTPEGTSYEQVVSILKQNDCFVCHSQQPQMPFYASFPVIGPTMKEHVTHAVRFTDLESKVVEDIDEVTLSMLDHCVAYNTMPIAQYKMVHWGTSFTKKEKSIIAAWVLEKRGSAEPVAAIPESVEFDEAKAGLGERMFYDKRISLDGTLNCASCHILEIGGADEPSARVSDGINGLKGGVNAPTVYNSAWNIRQFWNGRAADLREQAEGPATNPVEMGDQTWDQIVERLKKDKALVKEFEALYPGEGLTRFTVTSAIAEFEKTLITPGSRFDKYLGGDEQALSKQEIAGYEAFKKNACATCHTGATLGGRSFEYIDVYGNYFADRDDDIAYGPDDDGLKGFTGNDADLHKFKVPSLRVAACTAPYFHDGSEDDLDDAVEEMAEYVLGKDLSDAEVDNIVAFMRSVVGYNSHLTKIER